ncbi:MAG: ECF transporter S component [Lachnospiraceae bacterium]|jgi:uncharacterized membrane protein
MSIQNKQQTDAHVQAQARTAAAPADKTHELVITALFVALTYVFTWLINIRLPLPGSGGLIHLGNIPLLVAAMLYGRKTGAIAGGVGMGLFDLLSGWTLWAPFTFVIVGFMGWTVGMFAEKQPIHNYRLNYIAAVACALVIKVVGYYLAEIVITGNWAAPVGSIPGNVLQVTIAGIIVFMILPAIRRYRKI